MAAMAHLTTAVDYSSLPNRQLDDCAISPTLHWDESLYDNSALLDSFSLNSIDRCLGSPVTPLYSDDKFFYNWDEFNALGSSQLVTDIKLAYPHAMPSVRSQTSVNQEAIANGKGDSGITLEESLNDEPLCQSPGALPQNMDVTFRVDNGHSPFSWEQSRFDYQVETPKPHARLSPTEKARLCSIAMPSQSFTASPLSFSLSPDPEESRSRRSRTSSESSESDCLAPRSRRPINKRKAHNVVERRYRTNLADKITVLRDSIPSLRAVAENNSPDEDSPGCSNATKLNKATILSTATEYIGHLENRTLGLTKENKALQTRIEAFEILFVALDTSDSAKHAMPTGS